MMEMKDEKMRLKSKERMSELKQKLENLMFIGKIRTVRN